MKRCVNSRSKRAGQATLLCALLLPVPWSKKLIAQQQLTPAPAPPTVELPDAPSASVLSGTVTDSSGRPAGNICVQAFSPASLGSQEAVTGRTGHYAISGLDSGRYSVYFAPCSVRVCTTWATEERFCPMAQ